MALARFSSAAQWRGLNRAARQALQAPDGRWHQLVSPPTSRLALLAQCSLL